MSLQPMIILGVGSTGQLIVNRLRQYLYPIFQEDLHKLKNELNLMTIETSHGTEIDPELESERILISTTKAAGDILTIDDLRSRLGVPLYFLDALEVSGADDCNTYGGAGNVRFKGRLSLWHNWVEVESNLFLNEDLQARYSEDVENFIRPHALGTDDKGINISSGIRPIVYIVGTLGGGTCSGSFIELAYLVRKNLGGGVPIYGIFAIPQTNWPKMDLRVKGNFYGSLSELEYYSKNEYLEIPPTPITKIEKAPYELVFLVQWDQNDPDGTDLCDCVACKILFDFFGMEAESTAIRKDHSSLNRKKEKYLWNFELAGMCYPKYDLIVCAACRLAQDAAQIIYNKAKAESRSGKRTEQPPNFIGRGRGWIEEKIILLFDRFYQLTVGGKSSLAEFIDTADELPHEVDPERRIQELIDSARQVFRSQIEFSLNGDPTDKKLRGLGPIFNEECRQLFLEWRNIRVIQHFVSGIEEHLRELEDYWGAHFGRDKMDMAVSDISNALGPSSLPERGELLYQLLKQDILDGLIVEVLFDSNFFVMFKENYLAKIIENRPDNALQPQFDKKFEENVGNITKKYRTVQKVNRYGRVLDQRLIKEEIDTINRNMNPEEIITKELWDKWIEPIDKKASGDPIVPFLLQLSIKGLLERSDRESFAVRWEKSSIDRLKDFENDINEGKGIFTPASNTHEGYKGVKGVPKFLIANSQVNNLLEVKLEFGQKGESKNGIKAFPFLEDFLVLYQERTEFGFKDLKIWEESKQAFESYPDNYMCQTIPFNDIKKMRNLDKKIKDERSVTSIKKNLRDWVHGMEQFFLDFCLQWSQSGNVKGLSELGVMIKDHATLEAVGSELRVIIELEYKDRSIPFEKIPVYPKCNLADALLRKPDLLISFLEILRPIFEEDKREELSKYFNNNVRKLYPARGFSIEEETDRKEIYFESSRDRQCVLDAFYLLYNRRDILPRLF